MKILKIYIYIIIYSVNTLFAQVDQKVNKFFLTGELIGKDTGNIYLGYFNSEEKYIRDTAKLNNGKFFFKGIINYAYAASLTTVNKKKIDVSDVNYTEVFLEPSVIKISLLVNDFKHAIVTGSKTQNEFNEFKKIKEIILKDKKQIEIDYSKILDSLKENKTDKELLNKAVLTYKKFIPFNEKEKIIDFKYISSHPKSYLSAYLLMYNLSRLSLDSIKLFYKRFSIPVRSCFYGKEVEYKIEGSDGSYAKDFKAIDLNKDTISISGFKTKSYVLLDFWATYCGYCRSSNSHLIELYHLYHSKGLEIIGIADDDERIDLWKQAIIEDKTNIWYQVLRGANSNEDINRKYGINPIPTIILIDKSGQIIFRNENNNHLFLDRKLKEIFGE